MITHCATTKEITPLRACFWAPGGELRLRHDRRLFDIKDGDRLPMAAWRSQNGLPGTTAMIGAEQQPPTDRPGQAKKVWMTRYVALLRAVNVGGTGKLPMSELRAMCCEAGFARVETYIASGNVVFESKAAPSRVKAELERRLHAYVGKPVGVVVRTAPEMLAVLKANPFPKAEPKYTYAIFLDAPPPAAALSHVSGQQDEQMHLGKREIFVHYASGMGRSKLRIPAARTGTARNMNTVAKLAEIASRP